MKRLALIICVVMFLGTVGAFAAPKKGTMKDSRDGKAYKTVQIGKSDLDGGESELQDEGQLLLRQQETQLR